MSEIGERRMAHQIDEQSGLESLLAGLSKVIIDVAESATPMDGQVAADKLRDLMVAQQKR